MTEAIFDITTKEQFEHAALDTFAYQYDNNPVYHRFCNYLGKSEVKRIKDIPYLPIQFFKSHVISCQSLHDISFTSSGTTGMIPSTHHVHQLQVYHDSLDKSFEQLYGHYEDYVVLALLPHYLERTGSSLVYMVDRWITKSNRQESGFYLHNQEDLIAQLKRLKNEKILLIGVTFALLQLAEAYQEALANVCIIETGGMKGMRREMIKEEVHQLLKKAYPTSQLHSEYGMTELLSQAYAEDGIHFSCPPWMQVTARDTNDPLSLLASGKTGGLNIIDLANRESCSFIATQDLGKVHDDGRFSVLGRFDQSDIRGCNLLAIE